MDTGHRPHSSLLIAQGIVRSFNHDTSDSGLEAEHSLEVSDANGAADPRGDAIELVVSSEDEGVATKHRFEDTFILIGRSQDCDLSLADDHVSSRHAYLQKILGRVVCVDLASSNGTYWPDGRKPFGWFDEHHPVSIGKYHIRLVPPAASREIAPPEFDPESFFKTYAASPDLPQISLEYLSDSGKGETWTLSRTITLVGASDCCKLRLQHETVSRVHCSLILLPHGLWIVDLRGNQGTLVNEERIRSTRLDDGDVFQVGKYVFRVRYLYDTSSDSNALMRHHALAGKVVSNEFAGELISQIMTMQQQFLQHSQQQTEMMMQFFGSLYQHQYELLAQELARVREIDFELRELRSSLRSQADITPGSPPTAGAETRVDSTTNTDSTRRLKHVRTVEPRAEQTSQEMSLEEVNWKLAEAVDSDREEFEQVIQGKSGAAESACSPVGTEAEVSDTSREESGVDATNAEPDETILPAANASSVEHTSGSPEAADAVQAAVDGQTDAITAEESFEEQACVPAAMDAVEVETAEEISSDESCDETEASVCGETDDASEDEPDCVENEQSPSQEEVDHHSWILSRMHQLERERDGIFRKMMNAVFKSGP